MKEEKKARWYSYHRKIFSPPGMEAIGIGLSLLLFFGWVYYGTASAMPRTFFVVVGGISGLYILLLGILLATEEVQW